MIEYFLSSLYFSCLLLGHLLLLLLDVLVEVVLLGLEFLAPLFSYGTEQDSVVDVALELVVLALEPVPSPCDFVLDALGLGRDDCIAVVVHVVVLDEPVEIEPYDSSFPGVHFGNLSACGSLLPGTVPHKEHDT